MANFDSNKWYQITVKIFDSLNFASSTLYHRGTGAVFFRDNDTSDPAQQWQIWTTGTNEYVLRSKEGGPTGYLTAAAGNSSNPENMGDTVPNLSNYTVADESMYWSVGSWRDGYFYLSNKANGTGWRLNAKTNGLMTMSSNITNEQPGERFSFKELGDINDKAYSELLTEPSATGTTTGTQIHTATTTATHGPNTSGISPSSSAGLSTGAKAGIGVGVAVVVLIAIILGAFIFFRRRRRRQAPGHQPSQYYYNPVQPMEMSSEAQRMEMDGYQIPAEAEGEGTASDTVKEPAGYQEPPAELPANISTWEHDQPNQPPNT